MLHHPQSTPTTAVRQPSLIATHRATPLSSAPATDGWRHCLLVSDLLVSERSAPSMTAESLVGQNQQQSRPENLIAMTA